MKKVMHIAQAAGGVERYLYSLLKKLDDGEYENILICSQDYDVQKFKGFTDTIIKIEMHRDIKLKKEISAICRIRKLIKKYKPDIIYMHSSKAGAIGRIANMGINNVSIYNAHGWAFNMKCSHRKALFYQWIEKVLALFCNQIIAISEFEKKTAIENKICREDKIQVIYNGIDLDEYNISSASESIDINIPDNAFVIGCVGRLSIQKAPDIFIQSAKLVKEKIQNAFFIMVGDGEQRREIEKLIESLNLQECTYITGWVQNPLNYVEKMNIATLLSRWEGFGLVLPEYMLLEKPIVATRTDAIPEIIKDGENGILVNVDDCNGIAEAIIKIYKSNDLQKKFMLKGKEIVTNCFNSDRVAKEHVQLFNKLLNKK